jgi:hypothetical protein
VKTNEIELSDDELCRIVGEYIGKEKGETLGKMEITETDDQRRFTRFRVKE